MTFLKIAIFRNALLLSLCFLIFSPARILTAQDNPQFKIDETVTRFAFSGDGRIAFSVRHIFSEKKIQLQRDDVWIAERDGRKRRIFQGDKFVRGTMPFSYSVRSVRWSADSTKIAIELATEEMINDAGDTREGVATLLLDDSGREIQDAGGDSLIPGSSDAAWLADGATLAYFIEQQEPSAAATGGNKAGAPRAATPLERSFSMMRTGAATGIGATPFSGRLFSVLAWSESRDFAIAIERSPETTLHPRLVQMDPAKNASRDLSTLDGYAGGLTISPSGKLVAYWVDNEKLELRDVNSPDRVARARIALGTLAWSGDEARVLVKRGATARSGDLVWVELPALAVVEAGASPKTAEVTSQPILHDLEFRQFDISPDGKLLAVVEPGKRNLLVYSLP